MALYMAKIHKNQSVYTVAKPMRECIGMHMHTRLHSCPILHCFFVIIPFHSTRPQKSLIYCKGQYIMDPYVRKNAWEQVRAGYE